MKVISFVTPLYEASVVCIFRCPFSKFLATLKKRHGGKIPEMYSWDEKFEFGDDADTTNAYQFHVNAIHGDGEVFYIWIHEIGPNLLAHELFHLTGDILFNRGIGYDNGGEEGYAYLHGWIFEKVFTGLRGRIPKK